MSSIMGGKAISLISRGGVHKVPDAPGAFDCDGSEPGSSYRVQLGQTIEARDSCTCRAGECGRACYHVKAAKLWLSRERDRAQREKS